MNRGFIALLSTIVISLVLLVMITEGSFTGWYARFIVLSTQNKDEAVALAEGCVSYAAAALASDSTYAGNTTYRLPLSYGEGVCTVGAVVHNTPLVGQATVRTEAVVGRSYASFAAIIDSATGRMVSMQPVANP